MTSTALAPTGAGPISVVEAPEGPREVARSAPASEFDFDRVFLLCERLVRSNLLPKHIRTPENAFAIVLAGHELGLPPMLALRSLNLVEGKVTCAADLLLARFKADGGRAVFRTLDETGAVLWLRHPNGDEHIESFTIEDAKRAGLLGKDNWKHYPKAMLRSRVITAGLKSVGYEPTAGVYDPDELPVPSESAASVPAPGEPNVARVSETSDRADAPATPAPKPMTLDEARAVPFPWKKPPKYAGKPLGELSYNMLTVVRDAMIKDAAQYGPQSKSAQLKRACDLLIEAYEEGEQRMGPTTSTSGGSSPSATNGNSASIHGSSPDASDLPDEDDADDYVDELTPAERDEPKPPPAKGAPDSVYALVQQLRQLIAHPAFPADFRDVITLDLRTKARGPKAVDWLQRTIEAAQDVLAGAGDSDQPQPR